MSVEYIFSIAGVFTVAHIYIYICERYITIPHLPWIVYIYVPWVYWSWCNGHSEVRLQCMRFKTSKPKCQFKWCTSDPKFVIRNWNQIWHICFHPVHKIWAAQKSIACSEIGQAGCNLIFPILPDLLNTSFYVPRWRWCLHLPSFTPFLGRSTSMPIVPPFSLQLNLANQRSNIRRARPGRSISSCQSCGCAISETSTMKRQS